MPQRRGSGGGGASPDSVLRQGLRDLLAKVDRAASGGGDGGARRGSVGAGGGSRGRNGFGGNAAGGAGNTSGGGATTAGRPPQQGDWVCRGCNFAPNFARRRNCFSCKRPRSPRAEGRASSASGAGALARGPIGAGGLRPLLGGRGTVGGGAGNAAKGEDRSPTHRVPGSSVAAGASAAAPSASWAAAAKRAVQGGAPTPPTAAGDKGHSAAGASGDGPIVDADGFQTVAGRFRRKGGAADNASVGGDGARGATSRQSSVEGRQAGADATSTPGEEKDGGDHDEQATAEELQRAWLGEVAFVKRLRQQGVQSTHPAMLAACEARDAAERAWRGSKEPAPAAVRLGRAQQKLDRAVTLQAEARQAIVDAEAAHKERLAALQVAMDESTERVRLRRRQLREVQEEVGAGSAGDGDGRRAHQCEAIRKVHDSICADIGPTVAALVEQLDTEAPAWAALNGVLGKLAASKEALEHACAPRAAPQYDIGDDEQDRWESWSAWSESHDMHGGAWGGRRDGEGCADVWPRGGGRGSAATGADADDGDDMDGVQDQYMGTDNWWDIPAHRWGGGARWQPCGHGKWSRASWADQLEREHDGLDDDDDGDCQPAAARRRLDGDSAGQHKEGAPPTQPQQHAQAQASAARARASDGDPEEQKRLHSARLDAIIAMAVDTGVTPLTQSGEDLHLLDPHQLDAWVAENLPTALLC